jgi:rhodanese-related sulfurtransferase
MKLLAFIVLLIAFSIAGLAVQATAAEGANPPRISLKDLKTAMAKGKVTLLDCNGTQAFSRRHISGAIDLAVTRGRLAALLPAQKDALIVSYCSNENCPMYKQGVEAAAQLGYTKIKYFAPGIRGWINAGETTEAVANGK